jgi:histidyl-tRNA synthetase
MAKFNVARGTRDFLPEEMVKRKYVERTIQEIFESYGFQKIQTPTFEEFKLFSARSGPEIREGMFTFFCDNEEFALRPELTAAVCRLITTGKLNIPKPYEIYYIGQCFRYERPQSGRYREFTQAGLELMGTKSPMADAKVIAVAASVLKKLGIENYNLKVGNIGVYRDLLADGGFDFDKQCEIISSINKMIDAKEKLGVIRTKKQITDSDKEFLTTKMSEVYRLQNEIKYSGSYEVMPIPTKKLNEEKIRGLLKSIPKALEETMKIILSKKYSLKDELIELIFKIADIKGPRREVEDKARKLLKETAAEKALNDLFDVLEWLEIYGVKEYNLVLGVARGLDFYTGTVFEFDLSILDAQKQVCGGGRYDKLVEEFGGPSTPATGFAFGFDRLVEALERLGKSYEEKKADFFISSAEEESKKKAVEICQKLRAKGIRCEEDLNCLDLRKQMDYAKKLGIKYFVITGKKEIASGKLTLINLKNKKRKELKLEEIGENISF